MHRVAITGLGVISPCGINLPENWNSLLTRRSGIKKILTSHNQTHLAGEVSRLPWENVPQTWLKDLKRQSRFVQLAFFAAWEALQDAKKFDLPPEEIGCLVGVGMGGMGELCESHQAFLQKGKVTPFFIPKIIPNMASGTLSQLFHFQGPSFSPSSACASGTHAIGLAWQEIREGRTSAMLCGGAEAALCPITFAAFHSMKALSTNDEPPEKASKPFHKLRNGFVLSEGAGFLFLENWDHAKKRQAKIYGEVLGFAMTSDAYHMTSLPPHGEGIQRCLRNILKTSNLQIHNVDYINAHGTGTLQNDLVESLAIQKIFGPNTRIPVSSTKALTGHALGAAGGMEAVFLTKTLHEGTIPPTAHLDQVDPLCTLDYVVDGPRENKNITVGLSHSFGFGGMNAILAIKKYG